jgi:GntR family transcriptional regulator
MLLNRLVPFEALVAQAGHRATTDPQMTRRAPADAEQAATLQIQEGDPIIIVTRIIRANRRPVITVTDLVPEEELTVDPAEVREASSTFEFLQINADAAIEYATSEVVPRVAGVDRPEHLGLEPGTPFLQLYEVHFSAAGERIASSVICIVDEVVRLSMIRRGL